MSQAHHQVKLRLPRDVIGAIQMIAANNGRSATQEIAIALETFVHQNEKAVRTQVRLPPFIHQELTAAAKRNGRSMNAELVARLIEQRDA